MRANEFLTELGNKPYPFSLETNTKDFKTITTKDGKLTVYLEGKWSSQGWGIDIVFRVNGTTDMTGGGDQFRIFSTVAAILEKRLPTMINQLDPYAIWFHAKNADESRVSLYDKYAVRFFNQLLGPDWKFETKTGPNDTLYQWVHKPEMNEEITDEMALQQFTPMGDFNKPGPFRGVDKRLVPHPTNQLKTAKFFEQTPYDFRLFFSNIPGTGKYRETGPVNAQQLQQMFGEETAHQIIDGSDDAITVVFVGNSGDSKVMMTPWIMAHRIGHAIQAGERRGDRNGTWRAAEQHFFQGINNLLVDFYGRNEINQNARTHFNTSHAKEYNALFNAIGTQRSSRTNQITRPYEFMYELFAQYLGTGNITLNPLPQEKGYGRQAWGRSTKSLHMRHDMKDESQYTTEVLARDMELMFDDVLSSLVGKILVM